MEQIAQYVSRVANETYGHSRRLMPEQPWWNTLDPAFHKYPDDFYLDLKSQFMVDSTAAIDMGIRVAVTTMVTGLALPTTFRPGALKQDYAQWEFYQNLASTHDTEAFFKRPQQKVASVRKHKPGFLDYRPKDGHVEILSFESHFQTVNPALRDTYASNKRNRIAWAEHWRHGDKPRPTLCVIHGFLADPYWVNSRFLALPWFFKQGYDVLLFTLPFHGRRQEKTSPFSGHGYFSHGFAHLNETIAHSIHDFRLFMDYLFESGVPQIGVTGISLGGYTTALLAAVEDRLSFAIPNVPLASAFDLALQWPPAGTLIKAGLRLADSSIQEARHATAVSCPLTYNPRLPKDRLMIVGGAGDRFAPPKHARLLWDHWNRPALHWFPGNHLIHLDQGKYLREMAEFLRQIGFDKN